MGITRLQLYNNALQLCGERPLADLTEDREPKRNLDQVFNSNGVDYCLERGQWWFAMRAVMIDYDPAISPSFGYQYAFTRPDDWISTSAVCSDEFFRVPLIGHTFEMSEWYAAITPVYIRYVSNHANFGGDMSIWPATFADYVAANWAGKIIGKIAGDKSDQKAALFGPPGRGLIFQRLHEARAAAALTQPTMLIAQGNWSRARMGRRSGYNDRGNTGSLIG